MTWPIAIIIVAGIYHLYKVAVILIEAHRADVLRVGLSAFQDEVTAVKTQFEAVEEHAEALDKRLQDIENAWAFQQGGPGGKRPT